MRIQAFTGLRYDPSRIEPGPLAAPPFDQIGEALRKRLHREPMHFARLTRPVPADGASAEASAAALHRGWLAEGLVTRDRNPSLYPYLVETPAGEARLGLCALVAVEPPGSGVILPHEQVVPRTVESRLRLLRETRLDLEPILLLCDDGGGLDSLLEAAADASEPLVSHLDGAGNRHHLRRLEDAGWIERFRSLLADQPAWIADGHHRYEVARRYCEEVGAGESDRGGAKLAVISSLRSPGLAIEPIHRGLATGATLSLPEDLPVARRSWVGAGGRELAAAAALAGQPALGFRIASQAAEIWELGAVREPSGSPDPSVVLLHRRLLSRLGLSGGAATDGSLVYRSDPDRLWKQVETGELSAGFWLPPMKPSEFAAAVRAGELLPPKSTRFTPKLISGLVWAPIDASVG